MWPFLKRKKQQDLSISHTTETKCSAEESSVASANQVGKIFADAHRVLDAYDNAPSSLTPDIENSLESPVLRQKLYKLLVDKSIAPYASLVRFAFKKEVAYRTALWSRTVQDDGDSFEGIYRCAFLLYRLADPKDIDALWEAKYLNMDVGTSMGAEFFIGAGLQASISYLAESSLAEAHEISEYISGYFSQEEALNWQVDWEKYMVSNISYAPD